MIGSLVKAYCAAQTDIEGNAVSDDGEFDKIVKLIVADGEAYDAMDTKDESSPNVEGGTTQVTIQSLIALPEMQESFSSEDDRHRHRAALLLAEILNEKGYNLSLKPAVVHLFVVFFCHRLADYPSLIPCLQALTALVTYNGDNLHARFDDLTHILQQICKEVEVQSMAQSIRYKVFVLLDQVLDLLDSDTIAGSVTDPDQLFLGLVSLGEGEKDPRCLLLYLTVVKKSSALFEDSLEADRSMQTRLFDACACYFPITFKPPADDTFGITSDMLIDALEESMCGVRSLLPIAVPFLVEQLLESELAVGKTHALKALVRLANDYGPRTTFGQPSTSGQPHLKVLAEALYDGVLVNVTENVEVGDMCVWAVAELSACMEREVHTSNSNKSNKASTSKDTSVQDWQDLPERLLQKATLEVGRNMAGLRGRNASRVLFAVARSGYVGCAAASRKLLPVLLPQVKDLCARLARSVGCLPEPTPPAAAANTNEGNNENDPEEGHVHGEHCNHDHDHDQPQGEEATAGIKQERELAAFSLTLLEQMLACIPADTNSLVGSVALSLSTEGEDNNISGSEDKEKEQEQESVDMYSAGIGLTQAQAGDIFTALRSATDLLSNNTDAGAVLAIGQEDASLMADVLKTVALLLRHAPVLLSKKGPLAASASGKTYFETVSALCLQADTLNGGVSVEGPNTGPARLRASARTVLEVFSRTCEDESLCTGVLSVLCSHMQSQSAGASGLAMLGVAALARGAKYGPFLLMCVEPLVRIACDKSATTNNVLTNVNAIVSILAVLDPAQGEEGSSGVLRRAGLVVEDSKLANTISTYVHYIANQNDNEEYENASISYAKAVCQVVQRVSDSSPELAQTLLEHVMSLAQTFCPSVSVNNNANEGEKGKKGESNTQEGSAGSADVKEGRAMLALAELAIAAMGGQKASSPVFASEASAPHLSATAALATSLCALHSIPVLEIGAETGISCVDTNSSGISGLLLAILVNKLPAGELLSSLLGEVLQQYRATQNSKNSQKSHSSLDYCTSLLLRTTRSLAMRAELNSPVAGSNSWQQQYFKAILHATSGEEESGIRVEGGDIASSLIVKHGQLLFSEQLDSRFSHVNIAMLWRQKMWSRLRPQLQTARQYLKDLPAPDPSSAVCVRNLQLLECALATTVPPAVLASCLDELIGTAVDTLCQLQITQALADDAGSDGSADACLTLCLNTLNQLLKAGGADALLPHVRQIVPLLLEAARQSPPARNRALALMCLGEVLKDLKSILNDRKRIVRKLAAECSLLWHI